jgi:hypothetical protein
LLSGPAYPDGPPPAPRIRNSWNVFAEFVAAGPRGATDGAHAFYRLMGSEAEALGFRMYLGER